MAKMMDTHDFFRHAQETRRNALAGLAVTGGKEHLEEMVIPRFPVTDTISPHPSETQLKYNRTTIQYNLKN